MSVYSYIVNNLFSREMSTQNWTVEELCKNEEIIRSTCTLNAMFSAQIIPGAIKS